MEAGNIFFSFKGIKMKNSFIDYSKKSFRLIFDNPILFVPALIQIFSLLITILPLINYIGDNNSFNTFTPAYFPALLILIFFLVIINLLIEIGVLFMIKEVVLYNETSIRSLFKGIKKYFVRIFFGSIIIAVVFGILSAIIAVPLFILTNLRILSFIVIFIFILALSTFIYMWETILVYEDCGVFKSIDLSFRFAKMNFGLLFLVNLLDAILTGDNKSKLNSNQQRKPINIDLPTPFFIDLIKPLSITLIVLLSLISIVLDLFFLTLAFVIYDDRRDMLRSEIELTKE
ncbi:hypothetical protein BET03_10375 [Thermohalobacter berrensis]|uniref:Uncharacterized protein n=1 Tax=Thermohalobacter berrensis TaxID=99594 RepID=A0A419T5I3_9FIRM|nr:hypothetical protein BET03_10375 [Thermohalobacter berrensis]